MLGGMRAVTWTQVAQCIILIIAYLVPVVAVAQATGMPLPQLDVRRGAGADRRSSSRARASSKHFAAPSRRHASSAGSMLELLLALILCLMIGTASLPHILMRYFTMPNVREARDSVGWGCSSSSCSTSLRRPTPRSQLEVYQNVIGKPIAACRLGRRTGRSRRPAHDQGREHDGILQFNEFIIDHDSSSWRCRRSPACRT